MPEILLKTHNVIIINLSDIKKVKKDELKTKVLFTVLILLIYRFGTFVPIPGINTGVIKSFFDTQGSGGMFTMVNLFSGGALERMSIFALNIMPYITASIVMQLMTSMNKNLENLKKEGDYGRSIINQYTRYLTIFLSFFQSIAVYYALSASDELVFVDNSVIFMWTTCVSLVGGTVMLMWFGEKITSSGIGNGISLIIFVGIVSSVPVSFSQILDLSRSGVYSWLFVIIFFVSFLVFIAVVCFVEKTHRKIRVQHPTSLSVKSKTLSDSSFIPLKINISGVIPPIFASSILMFPSALGQFMEGKSNIIINMFARGTFVYIIIFALLIIFFSFFYSSIIFNTKEVSLNLKKSNCFILGIRPGSNTSNYLDKIIARLTLIGAFYLIFICIIPEIIIVDYSIPLHIGGTGVLIVVNVILDLIGQIQSHLISKKYAVSKRRRKIRI